MHRTQCSSDQGKSLFPSTTPSAGHPGEVVDKEPVVGCTGKATVMCGANSFSGAELYRHIPCSDGCRFLTGLQK